MTQPHPYLSEQPPRAFAHRGWHLDELHTMENSLTAFRRAVTEGYRYLETDVHVTSDGVVVVHHDAVLDRTTDGTGPIVRQRWAQVRRAKIGGREGVARLEDLLEELPGASFNIDVKSDAAVQPFIETIQRTKAFARVAAAAFSDTRISRIRRLAGPKLITAMGPRGAALLWANRWVPRLRFGLRRYGAMAQVPVRHGRTTIVDKAFVRVAHHAGIEVHTWTINDAAEMRKLLDLGVQGIVTDRPDRLRDVLVERGSWHPIG